MMASSSASVPTKKCRCCRSDLLEGASSNQCDKCRKNEEKYGNPTTCKYCQLPAAFTEEKCVYCCYSERKHGAPVGCAHCKVKSAFPRHPKKPTLCRLCIITARQSGKHELGGVPIPSQKDRRSDVHMKHRPSTSSPQKRKTIDGREKNESTPSKVPKLDASASAMSAQNAMQQQKLQEKVDELTRSLAQKEKLIVEKDRQIAQMKADASTSDRKYREMLAQLSKEREDAVNAIHSRYKEANRQERIEKQERERAAQKEREKRDKEKKLKAAEKEKKEKEKKLEKEKEAKEKEEKVKIEEEHEKENEVKETVKEPKEEEEEEESVKKEDTGKESDTEDEKMQIDESEDKEGDAVDEANSSGDTVEND